MLNKADRVLGFFTINSWEPEQDVYYSQEIPFSSEEVLEGEALYCIQDTPDAGAVIVSKDGSFLVTGHTRKGRNYLLNKWLAGERTPETYLDY